MAKKRDKTIYEVPLQRPSGVQPPHKTSQSMDHLPDNVLIREVEMLKYGVVERDGKQYHSQTIRLLIEEL